METHTAMVMVYHEGELIPSGGGVNYTGKPDWKYRPNDPAARAEWEQTIADPERVVEMLDRQRPDLRGEHRIPA